MYPQQELTRLTAYKAALLRDIATHRAHCAKAAGLALQPLALLDRMLALWRKFSPLALFAAMPLGFLVQRTVAPRLRIVGPLLRWGPLIFTAVCRIRSAMTTHSQQTKH
jgi:hypothetical protein